MKNKDKSISILIWATTCIIILWIISWFVVDNLYCNSQDRGTFGDKFGFVNSLFSGLGLGGIIYSLILQRQEFQEAREEFKNQNFQTIFFNLLQSQEQIANGINISIPFMRSYLKVGNYEVNGRQFFVQSRNELRRITTVLENNSYIEYHPFDPDLYPEPSDEDEESAIHNQMSIAYTISHYNIQESDFKNYSDLVPLKKAELVYRIFFNKYNFVIGHYFRHLYHIFKFINKTKDDMILNNPVMKTEFENEFNNFSDFVQAQMSIPELFLLFYNSLSFPKFQKLLIQFNTLENLPQEELLDISHNVVEGLILKSNRRLSKD